MATKTQRKNALKGHRKIEVDDEEFKFIKGVFGEPTINPKTKLEAFARSGGLGGAKENVFGNTVSGAAQQAEHQRVRDMGTRAGISSPGGGTPNININNPLADQGSTTQNFAGPSSRTRLDDPLEKLQGKVAGRASDLMDREY